MSSFFSESTNTDDSSELNPSETLSVDVDTTLPSSFAQSNNIDPLSQRHVKRGWNKVLNACFKACRDGYQYLWIDTCCIDKSSSAELSEAINSMFRWYSSAAICYAYVGDCTKCPSMRHPKRPAEFQFFAREPMPIWMGISRLKSLSANKRDPYSWQEYLTTLENVAPGFSRSINLGPWKIQHLPGDSDAYQLGRLGKILFAERPLDQCTLRSLRESRWLRRGWTLQELIAPRRLVFFDRHWRNIGRKSEMIRTLSSITGIHIPALCGDLSDFTVAQRMSWAVERQTTRTEDIAYCLLGLFNINMPLLYGEGPRAFQRLQEEILRSSTDTSILAWEQIRNDSYPITQLLAPSPAYFWWHAAEIHSSKLSKARHHMQLTNEGLFIRVHMVHWRQDHRHKVNIALLGCQLDDNSWIGIRLYNTMHETSSSQEYNDPEQDDYKYGVHTRVTAEGASSFMDKEQQYRRLVLIAPYILLDGPQRLSIALMSGFGHVEPEANQREAYDRCMISVTLPNKMRTGRSWRIVAAYPSFQWHAQDRQMIIPRCSDPIFGAVAFQENGLSGPTYALIFSATESIHWRFKVMNHAAEVNEFLRDKEDSWNNPKASRPSTKARWSWEVEAETWAKQLGKTLTTASCLIPPDCATLEQHLQRQCAIAEMAHRQDSISHKDRDSNHRRPIVLSNGQKLQATIICEKKRSIAEQWPAESWIGPRWCDFKVDVLDNEHARSPNEENGQMSRA